MAVMRVAALQQRWCRPAGPGAAVWLAAAVLCLLALAAPTHQVGPGGDGGPEAVEPGQEGTAPGGHEFGPEQDKRAWSDLQSGWGKRGWQDLQSGWGKRAWSDLSSGWGKRDWGSFRGAWGKRAWDDLRPMWGKRSWDNFHGSWGKRWPGDEGSEEEGEDLVPPPALSDEQLAQLTGLVLLAHAEKPPMSAVAAASLLSDEEQKRSWSNLRGAWGKRGWSNFKGSWGKKREPGWNNLKGLWGKRSDNSWNRLASVWGKRPVNGGIGTTVDSSTGEN